MPVLNAGFGMRIKTSAFPYFCSKMYQTNLAGMTLIRVLFAFLPFFLVFGGAYAQDRVPLHLPGQFLVRLEPGTTPEGLVKDFGNAAQRRGSMTTERSVSKAWNIWLLSVSPNDANAEKETLHWLQQQSIVVDVQFNHILEHRVQPPTLVPNDPFFSEQWHHVNTGVPAGVPNADFDSDQAWEITTGGLTPLGDTIVVAVIDGGFEYWHEDLTANVWQNRHEIPGDSLDNDGNGYPDDVRGWNVFGQNDDVQGVATGHGTPVASIVGAKGNNGIGVAGINWDVKLMLVAGNSDEATILEAYDYVCRTRKLYNDTQGAKGAFVVAVNCSWGVLYGQPSSAPLWCAAFDALGEVGILSVAATANTPLDVDVFGDLPTTCPSDYLIAVTNLNKWDQKASNAAWGANSIDLGAYGAAVFTAGAGNSYGLYSGTSFSAPQVSGAIGLLYASPCPNLTARAKANPGATALMVRDLLLNSTTPNNDLQNKTVTGGRLNLNTLITDYEDLCVSCVPPFALQVDSFANNTLALAWSQVADVLSASMRWRKKGASVWNLMPEVNSPVVLNNLDACSEYEFSLRATCAGNGQSSWSAPLSFRTNGCCLPPTTIEALVLGTTTAALTWNGATGATGYRIRYQASGQNWQETEVDSTYLLLSGLTPCTEYLLEIRTNCGPDSTSPAAVQTFLMPGCGACTDLNYCTAKATSAQDEWISRVAIGSWHNDSGGTWGYQDFTGQMDNMAELSPGLSVPITLTPAFSGLPYKEHFRVYIDYNADGDFNDADELAFDPGFASDTQVVGVLTPPQQAVPGVSRMRILMKYKGLQGLAPGPCESFEFGQVEDYCVRIGPSVSTEHEGKTNDRLTFFPQPASDVLWIRIPDRIPGASARVRIVSLSGQQVLLEKVGPLPGGGHFPLNISALAGGIYSLNLESEGRIWREKLLIVR